MCGIDFRNKVTPDDTALRTSVARLVTEIVRHDVVQLPTVGEPGRTAASRSYLLLWDRSAGQYLFDALLDACREYGIDVEGLADITISGPDSMSV